MVGGAAVTEEFHPGYRNSIASYVLSLLRPEIIRDLELKRHGLSLIPFRGALDILGDGRTLLFTGEEMHDRAAGRPLLQPRLRGHGRAARAAAAGGRRWCATSCCGSRRISAAGWTRSSPMLRLGGGVAPADAGGPAFPRADVHAERQRSDGALVRERGDAAGLCRALRLQQFREPGRAGLGDPVLPSTCSASSRARRGAGAWPGAAWARSPRHGGGGARARRGDPHRRAGRAHSGARMAAPSGVRLESGEELRARMRARQHRPEAHLPKLRRPRASRSRPSPTTSRIAHGPRLAADEPGAERRAGVRRPRRRRGRDWRCGSSITLLPDRATVERELSPGARRADIPDEPYVDHRHPLGARRQPGAARAIT